MLASLTLSLALAEGLLRWQRTVELDNFHGLGRYSNLTHHKFSDQPEDFATSIGPLGPCQPGSRRLKLLFLGDSWMLGAPLATGAGQYLAGRLGDHACLELLNGGTSSFSPSLILVQGLLLIERYRPDFVFVNIDETDLMDETLRYREKTIRNEKGEIVQVQGDLADAVWARGLREVEQHSLYLVRLAAKIYHDRIFTPRLQRLAGQRHVTASMILAPQVSAHPRVTHAEPIAYFESVLDEMVRRLAGKLGDPSRLIVSHHPHYLGVEALGPHKQYNDIVAEIVAEACRRRGVRMVCARKKILEIYGADFARYFRWPEDPFSHLKPEGRLRYGAFIGGEVYDQIAAASRTVR